MMDLFLMLADGIMNGMNDCVLKGGVCRRMYVWSGTKNIMCVFQILINHQSIADTRVARSTSVVL
jgi:hypothetical protein